MMGVEDSKGKGSKGNDRRWEELDPSDKFER